MADDYVIPQLDDDDDEAAVIIGSLTARIRDLAQAHQYEHDAHARADFRDRWAALYVQYEAAAKADPHLVPEPPPPAPPDA